MPLAQSNNYRGLKLYVSSHYCPPNEDRAIKQKPCKSLTTIPLARKTLVQSRTYEPRNSPTNCTSPLSHVSQSRKVGTWRTQYSEIRTQVWTHGTKVPNKYFYLFTCLRAVISSLLEVLLGRLSRRIYRSRQGTAKNKVRNTKQHWWWRGKCTHVNENTWSVSNPVPPRGLLSMV